MAEAKEITDSVSQESSPHLEVLDRMKNIPVIHSAIEKTGSTYSYLKDSNHLINWALSYAEAGLHYATATAAPIAAPLAKKFEGQITAIYDAAKAVMSSSLQPTIDKLNVAKESASQQASTLKEISISKANELLNTSYGNMAVQSVDNTSLLISHLLDCYFPPVEGEEEGPVPVSADENKVLHAVQTIGQLSSKTANRVYHSVAAQLKTVKKEDVSSYISNVVSILHLTHFLSLNDKQNDKEGQNSSEENKGNE